LKRKDFSYFFKFAFAIFYFIFINSSFSQIIGTDKYQYISPIPGSAGILQENNIIIRQGAIIDFTTINETSIEVTGSICGKNSGDLILSDDLKTLIFNHQIPFEAGEEVIVNFEANIKTITGNKLPPFKFNFYIVSESNKSKVDRLISKTKTIPDVKKETRPKIGKDKLAYNLSGTFPQLTINISNNPSPGNIFIALNSIYESLTYLAIMGNNGIPIYYSKSSGIQRNFQLQPNRLLTYFDQNSNKFFEMDSSYKIIDTFYCKNGFEPTTDFHDLIVLENGHSILMARDVQVVRMDTIVAGGDSAAMVSGYVIQELDANKNVVFQWRTLDHFHITDATDDINLLNRFINPYHCNSLATDFDGNILLSSRHLDEITKINRVTGEIIWRWGGSKSKNNEFLFINDPITFSHQHNIGKISGTNITMFDNGNLHAPSLSRALEYSLDEVNKTATLIWSFSNNPGTFSGASGSTQRLSGGNSFIGWGIHEGVSPDLTEVNVDGSIALDISLPDSFSSYRVYKHTWKTNLFLTDPDSIFYKSVSVGDSAISSVLLKNYSSSPINITSFYIKNSVYKVEHPVPFTLIPSESEPIEIKFKPITAGFFKDTLHIRSDTDTSRIAQVLFLSGRTDTSFSGVSNENIAMSYVLEQNYPNPFNPSTIIKYQIPVTSRVTLKIFDILGCEVETLVDEEKPAGNYEVEFFGGGGTGIKRNEGSITSSVYFYQIYVRSSWGNPVSFLKTKKMLLLK